MNDEDLKKKYVFKPYHPLFPILFERERKRLSKFLTGSYHIEHVGSTAVKNLGGKGIIDLYIVAPRERHDQISQELLKAGYEYRPKVSEDQHVFHVIEIYDPIEVIRKYHIHLNTQESEDYKKTILFRDYLREHPQDVALYAQVKQRAVVIAQGSKEAYMKSKAGAIKKILQKASFNNKE